MSGESAKTPNVMNLFAKGVLSKCIEIDNTMIDGKNTKELLTRELKQAMEGRCIREGYIKRDSVQVVSYSAPKVVADKLSFMVVTECLICDPCEGDKITCSAINITKAGLRCEVSIETEKPIVVFVARDHNFTNKRFAQVKENDVIQVKIVGVRYELNDEYISVIGELI